LKIIDAHIHLSDIESFRHTARELSFVDYSSAGLEREFAECQVVAGIGMGVTEANVNGFPDRGSANPMGLNLEKEVPDFLLGCVGVNPVLLERGNQDEQLAAIEAELRKESTAGIKIYAGYYPYYVYDRVYEPVYELAEKYGLPVVIHTGDTYSQNGLLEYSHPLTVDRLAVKHRYMQIIICHLGDPWVMDGAEVVSKNPNVAADLSGLIVGDHQKVERFMNEPLFMDHFRRALVYADNYDKFLFGTDWPLVPVAPYIEFVKALIPEKHHENVFYRNALQVFPRLKKALNVTFS
jgi:predicted TIM-barrel fold metal-dependent hydrolase